MSDELKPCPFCGKSDKVSMDYVNPNGIEPCEFDDVIELATCERCGLNMNQDYYKWNDRPLESTLQARNNELVTFIGRLVEVGTVVLDDDISDAEWDEYCVKFRTLINEWRSK